VSEYPLPRPTGKEPCRTGDPERFHPEPGNPRAAVAAKKECQGCPLLDECLDYALHVRVSGVWGGTSESERRVMRRRLHIVAEPVIPQRSDFLHDEMRRKYRAGVGPGELAREYRMSPRHVQRICTGDMRYQQAQAS
jgi:WhiB family redox-sensing transcriptional regulator